MSAAALAAAALALASAPHDPADHAGEPAGPRPPAVVGMQNKVFHPGVLDVVVGDTVRWHNDDGSAHDVRSEVAPFDSGRLERHGRFDFIPAAQGTIPYRCTLHPFMTGRLVVHGLGLDGPAGQERAGTPVALSGRAPAGVGEVVLELLGAGGTWAAAARAAPSGGGTFTVTVSPRAPVVVRARSGDLLSRELRVAAAPEVVARARRRGPTIAVSVGTSPAQPGAHVRLERYVRERFDWRSVARARLDGSSRATLRLRSRRRERLRVAITRGVGGYGPATGRAVTVPRLR